MGYYLERASSGYFKGHSARRTRVVYLIWGMKNQDLSACHKTDALCVGDSVWDDEFDLSSVENQKALQVSFLKHRCEQLLAARTKCSTLCLQNPCLQNDKQNRALHATLSRFVKNCIETV